MKLPNGFGSVYKLSGNRRNPYIARKTQGWEINPETGKSKQLYTVIGYYPTRKDALNALAEFNTNPYDVNAAKITFEDVYERWSDEHFPTVSHSNVQGYKAAWALCRKIARMRFVDVKLDHLQIIVDESGKNYPTLRKLKTLLGLIYKYVIIHEIIPKERNLIEYLNIKNAGNPNAYDRKLFTKTEGAIVARKRMSGHVSLNTAAKRAIDPSFFIAKKCLTQDFKSLTQDHISFVSYVLVIVKILCDLILSHRKFRI